MTYQPGPYGPGPHGTAPYASGPAGPYAGQPGSGQSGYGQSGYAPAPYGTPVAPVRRRPGIVASGLFMGTWLFLLWALEGVDTLLGGALDQFGVSPRDPAELPQILTAPFLHFGFSHVAANSIPFLVLGLIVLLSGGRQFLFATVAAAVGSGLFAWLLSEPRTVTAGASGLVFGWLAFLLVRGLFAGNWKQILIAAAVFGFFGGILWGIFPGQPGISWQGHLGGAVGGGLAAWWLVRRAKTKSPAAT